MAKGSNGAAGAIILTIILSATLGVGAYFGLPFLFPGMDTPAYVYQEFDNEIIIEDSDLAWQNLTGIEVNFTKQHDSKIEATFNSLLMLGYLSDNRMVYEISLCVENAGNRTSYVGYLDTGIQSIREVTTSFMLIYTTGILPAGTYRVYVMARSLYDLDPESGYALFNNAIVDYNSSLTIQEIL
jgi:hypothetical protein